jgi:protein SCO1/2
MSYRWIQAAFGVTGGLILVLILTRLPGGPVGGVPAPLHPNLVPSPFQPAPLSLVDARGEPWTLADERGRVTAIFFGYTHCPDVCPLTLARLGRIQEELSAAGEPPLSLVFVSVDPARDSAALLRTWSSRLPGSVRAVTAADVREQAFDFGVIATDLPGPEGYDGYLVDHSARTFILDPRGLVTATLPPMVSPQEARETLEAVYDRVADDADERKSAEEPTGGADGVIEGDSRS